MTVVAQRHTTQDIHGDHLAAKQIKHQWLFLSVFLHEIRRLQDPPPPPFIPQNKKKKHQHPPSSPHQRLVQFTKKKSVTNAEGQKWSLPRDRTSNRPN